MPEMNLAISAASLDARLLRLERQNRRLRRSLLALAACMAALAGLGWLAPASHRLPAAIEARSIVLRDALGRRRIELGTGRHGGSGFLRLYSRHGKLSAELAVWPHVGPALRLLDAHRTPRVDLSYLTGVGSSLELFDARGRRHVTILEAGQDRPSIRLSDADGRQVILGSARVRLAAREPPRRTPANTILRLGRNGRLLWQAP